MVENHHVTSDWDYILNVRPNKNESASEFWQKVIYRLLTKNEVLIVLSDDKQLLVADAFTRRRYALYDDTFEMVSELLMRIRERNCRDMRTIFLSPLRLRRLPLYRQWMVWSIRS
ncbi:HK97 family phage portal protein [Streptococcus pneumoniae]|nr:HK97 family phage portal protein [Streptococcus pneumoniae]